MPLTFCFTFFLLLFIFLSLSVLLVPFQHTKTKTPIACLRTFVLTFDLQFLPQCIEIKAEPRVSPVINWLRLKMISAQCSFLGTFQGTFSCLAICSLVYRAAKSWPQYRLWLTLWTRQSLVQGSVYKQCCTMCTLWPWSHLLSLCASRDLTLKITFSVFRLTESLS